MLCGRKDYFRKKPIFSKDYSLKEQTWLATYAEGCPHSEEVQPAAFILTCNAISKRQALPCLFIDTLHNLSSDNDGESENAQVNRPTWIDRESTNLNFDEQSIIIIYMSPFVQSSFLAENNSSIIHF